jgi:predicted O-methyltransferase YrrM
MATLQSTELLGVLEEALVGHRVFGDSAYILEQYEASAERRLGAIASQLPSAGRLLEALRRASGDSRYRVTGNTVIRCAISHAHTQVETDEAYGFPLADCAEIFEQTALHMRSEKAGTPFENGAGWLPRLGEAPYHGWIWREDYPDDLFGRSLRFLIENSYGDPLCIPSEDELACLLKGEQLLQTLVPLLAPSALSHVHLVGMFPHAGEWQDKASSSQIRLGGSIFLARSLTRSPWVIAEHMLHEALHQKLYDFRHGHTLLEPEYSERGAPRVRSQWNPAQLNDSNSWDTHRAVAAFHVYVQLALMARIAEERAPELEERYGPPDGLIDSRKAFQRAWYLGEQLRTVAWSVLGLAGQRMVDWLMSILKALEPSPPPDGAYLHLVLDLYGREAKKANFALKTKGSASLTGVLGPLVREEVETTRRVLASVSAGEQVSQLDTAVGELSDPEFAAQFLRVRTEVAQTLLDAAPDGYALTVDPEASEDPNEVVRQMVLRSSQRIHVTLENLPDAVAEAKRRANRLRITISCIDDVGRLLSVLAAAVPPGGRILEIGTSVGVGTAWICEGLADRTDVEVVSVEVDRSLTDLALEWEWPDHVQVTNADGADVLETVGKFNLMFVDASPVKHGHMEAAIAALQPGGVLVVDDLHNDMKNFEAQKAAKDSLRRLVYGHPELRAVELDWASGVMLAARTGVAG